MKKFLGLIVLLVALAVCAAALVACAPGSGNQATPQSIQFEDKDGADRSTYWDLGAFPYGTAYEDILPTFKVNLCYSDGSTKELAAGDYTVSYVKVEEEDVPLQSIPAVPDAGFYQIIFDKDTFQARMVFAIEQTSRPDSYLELASRMWSYDMAPAEMSVSGYTASEEAPVEFFGIEKSTFDALSEEEKEQYWLYTVPSVTFGDSPYSAPVGKYYAYAVIPAHDVYSTTYTPISQDTLVTVVKGYLKYPNQTLQGAVGRYTYNGSTLGWIALSEVHVFFDGSGVDALKDATGRTIYGEYVFENPDSLVNSNASYANVVFKLAESDAQNYTVQTDVTPRMPLEIAKGNVALPTVKAMNANYAGTGPYPANPNDYGVVKNDGTGYRIEISEWNPSLMNVLYRLDKTWFAAEVKTATDEYGTAYHYVETPAEVGSYTFRVGLQDSTNYVFEENGQYFIEYTFDINDKKHIPMPVAGLFGGIALEDGTDVIYTDLNVQAIVLENWSEGYPVSISVSVNGADYESVLPGFDGDIGYFVTTREFGVYSLLMQPLTEEYVWADGSCAPVVYTCEIIRDTILDVSGEYVTLEVDETGFPVDPTYAAAINTVINWINNKPLSYGADFSVSYKNDYTSGGQIESSTVGPIFRGTLRNTHQSGDTYGESFTTVADFVAVQANGKAASYSAEGAPYGTISFKDYDGITVESIDDKFVTALQMSSMAAPETYTQSDKPNFECALSADGSFKLKMHASHSDSSSGYTVTQQIEAVLVFDANGNYSGHRITMKITDAQRPNTLTTITAQLVII